MICLFAYCKFRRRALRVVSPTTHLGLGLELEAGVGPHLRGPQDLHRQRRVRHLPEADRQRLGGDVQEAGDQSEVSSGSRDLVSANHSSPGGGDGDGVGDVVLQQPGRHPQLLLVPVAGQDLGELLAAAGPAPIRGEYEVT